MTQMRFTKGHEREEGRLLSRGFAHSCAALALCWLPVVGLLMAVSGFFRVVVRLTKRHRRRRRACLVFSFLVLVLCTGVLLGEVWLYSRDPQILSRAGQQVWTFIVGEENAALLSEDAPQGTEYENMDEAGFGLTDTMGTENDSLYLDEDISAWDDEFDWDAWEDDEWAAWEEENTDAWEDDGWLDWETSGLEPLDENDGITAGAGAENAPLLGQSDDAVSSGSASMGKGEVILPPTE